MFYPSRENCFKTWKTLSLRIVFNHCLNKLSPFTSNYFTVLHDKLKNVTTHILGIINPKCVAVFQRVAQATFISILDFNVPLRRMISKLLVKIQAEILD